MFACKTAAGLINSETLIAIVMEIVALNGAVAEEW